MIEVELKSVVLDLDACRERLERAGASATFVGRLEDRRYDTTARSMTQRDHVLRVRVYRDLQGTPLRAQLDWKGPSMYEGGYKLREEIECGVSDANALTAILDRLGLHVTIAIDRQVWQYDVNGATVRFERYPRMDDLVEVEGSRGAIESAIAVLGLPRSSYTSDRLQDFVRRYEERTGVRAALSADELSPSGAPPQDATNA
jgi:predicted adenylyl cyclase CyaB